MKLPVHLVRPYISKFLLLLDLDLALKEAIHFRVMLEGLMNIILDLESRYLDLDLDLDFKLESRF